MYHEYFGLDEPAFSIAVNPKFLYMSQQHKEALAHLLYGVQEGGFVLLSGEVGTGKTTIIRCLLEQIPENTDIAYVLNPMADIPSLLATICDELRVSLPSPATTRDMMEALQGHLIKNHSKAIRTVLLIDEAQLLSVEVLEQIRLLTNLETSTQKLLQIVLVGQPEVNELLAQARLRQLSQRITARFHLSALSLEETDHYIHHRLKIAGQKHNRTLFPKSVIKRIHRFSKGTPRLINIICERAMVGAYGRNRDYVDKEIFTLALAEVEGTANGKPRNRSLFKTSFALAGLCITAFVGTLLWLFFGTAQAPVKVNAHPQNVINAPTAIIPKLEDNPVYQLSQNAAFEHLFAYQDISVSNERHPCWQSDTSFYTCDKQRFETWDAFLLLNRPSIFTVITEDKSLSYVVVIGESGEKILILDEDLNELETDKTQLLRKWNGQASYLWRKPTNFDGPLSQGTQSELITDIANKFALLDNKEKSLTDTRFNSLLQTRVKIFQKQHNLKADGIIGKRTLMKLNEELGLSQTLIRRVTETPTTGS